MGNTAAAYQQSRTISADPVDLVTMAYQRILREIATARACFERADISGRSQAITTSWEILAELYRMLDRQQGGEVAERLGQLYSFAMQRLLDANTTQNPAALDEVGRVIAPILDGWQQMALAQPQNRVLSEPKAETASWNPFAAAQEGGYQRQSWTL